jgi:hypothetical protein
MPDPKSFDTLEKAQAEIARLQALISQFCDEAAPLVEAMIERRTEIARVLAELP